MPRSADDVAAAITAGDESHAGRIRKAVEEALDDLEKKEIIRKRLDPDTRQHVWILDHDYLCRGVLGAERRANPWFVPAQEGYRAFQDAGSNTWRKLRSLLSLRQQVVLLTQRVRGRFRYGPLRSYAMWSLFRFVPYLLILTAIAYGWIEIRQRQQAELDRAKAAAIQAVIGLDESLSQAEIDHLWELANSQDAVRYSFIEQALEFPATAEQFNRRTDMAMQTVVGLDVDKRDNILKNSVLPRFQRQPPHLSVKIACVKIGIALAIEDHYPEFALFAVKTFIEAIDKISSSRQFDLIAGALKAVAEKLAPIDAQQAFTQLLTAIERSTDFSQLHSLAAALKAVAEKLAAAEVQWAFTQLLAAIDKTTNPRQLEALAAALQAVPGTIDPQLLINMLKWPTSIRVLRSTLLEMLERQTGQKFDGNIWKMVAWAQKHGLDVKSPPKRPNK